MVQVGTSHDQAWRFNISRDGPHRLGGGRTPCDTDIGLFIVLRGLMSVFGGCGVVVIVVVRAPGGVGRTMPDLVKSSKVAQVEWTISTSLD